MVFNARNETCYYQVFKFPRTPCGIWESCKLCYYKGVQEGLVAGIAHSKVGTDLLGDAAYHPSAEADYESGLQTLRELEFPLLGTLLSHKDASVTDIIDLLHLEGPLANAPGMADLQPDSEQLFILVHNPEDNVVVGSSSLSFALENAQ